MPIFQNLFKLHTDACGTGLGAVLYQTREDGTEAVIAYASRSLNKAESHYPAHKLEFLALKWAVVEKFHEYLYRSTFDVHTYNNLLTFILTTAKLDAASHCWVASLANYNFRLHYRSGKTNIDADALSRVSWLECMPDNLGTGLKVNAAAVRTIQEAALDQPACPTEAYSYDLHAVGAIQDSQQVAQVTLDDWQQTQEVDPVLGIIIKRLREGMLDQYWCRKTDSPELSQYKREQNNLVLQRLSCIGEPGLGNRMRPSCSWFCLLPIERLLSRDAMTRLAIWAWNACWISCMTCSFGLTWLFR